MTRDHETSGAAPKRSLGDTLANLQRSYDVVEAGIRRSREFLAEHSTEHGWYYGVVGLTPERVPPFTFSLDFDEPVQVQLRHVDNQPGEIALARALSDKGLLSSVSRYSRHVVCELWVSVPAAEEPPGRQRSASLARSLFALVRVRSDADFMVPVALSRPWDGVGAGTDDCDAVLIEDYPRARGLDTSTVITESDLRWVEGNLERYLDLLANPGFILAVECLTSFQFQDSARMSVARVWAGIEGLLGIDQEVTFRLSAVIASILCERGPARVAEAKRIRKMYAMRSKAVHGRHVSEDALRKHLADAAALLRRLLQHCLENEEVPSSNARQDEILFG